MTEIAKRKRLKALRGLPSKVEVVAIVKGEKVEEGDTRRREEEKKGWKKVRAGAARRQL